MILDTRLCANLCLLFPFMAGRGFYDLYDRVLFIQLGFVFVPRGLYMFNFASRLCTCSCSMMTIYYLHSKNHYIY